VKKWIKANADEYFDADLGFCDLGVSGWEGKHIEGGMGKLLAAIEAGLIRPGAVVLVEELSRAGRLPLMEMLKQVITPILEAGVSLITMDDGFVYTSESLNGGYAHVLVAKIQAANQFSERLSERLKVSYAERKEKAAAGVEKPKRRTPLWLDKDGKMIVNLEPHIKDAFEMYAGGYGERRILRKLKETGIKEFQGLYGSTLKRWLQNPTAMGNWGDIVNVYPRVVEPELFHRVQNRMASNKTTRPSSPSKHDLTGIVKCAHCKRNYNYHVFKKQPTVLQCSNRFMTTADKCENSKSIPLGVVKHIKMLTSIEAQFEAIKRRNLTVNQKRIIVIEGDIASLSQRLSGVARAIAAVGDSDELMLQLTSLTNQRRALQEELIILSNNSDGVTGQQYLDHVQSATDDPMQQGADLQTVGYTITIDKEGNITTSHGVHRNWLYVGWKRKTDEYIVHNKDTGKDDHVSAKIYRPGFKIDSPKNIVVSSELVNSLKLKLQE